MARYNTVLPSNLTTTASVSVTTPLGGLFTEFQSPTTAATIADPSLYAGSNQVFYNNAGATVTLTSGGSGTFKGPGASGLGTQSMPSGTTLSLYSDGFNWISTSGGGGSSTATSLTVTGTVSLSPANANVTISPTGTGYVTINPAALGTIDNVTVGGTTPAAGNFSSIGATSRGTGLFTSLGANSTVTLTPANANVTISPTGTGTVAISPAGALTISPTTASTMDNVRIGGTTPLAVTCTTLQVNSSISGTGFSTFLASPPAIGGTAAAAGTFTTLSCTSLTETSSIAFKTNINPLGTSVLDSVLKLTGVIYDRKDGSQKNEPGLIAEDVYKVLPELVQLKDGKPFGIHYTKITAYLVESIKALQAEIDELKGKKPTKSTKSKTK